MKQYKCDMCGKILSKEDSHTILDAQKRVDDDSLVVYAPDYKRITQDCCEDCLNKIKTFIKDERLKNNLWIECQEGGQYVYDR